MEDKKLNEKESLELITRMIQDTRRSLDGFIIGCYNMGNFAVDTGLYLGLYHLPLLGMSLYALLISKKEGK